LVTVGAALLPVVPLLVWSSRQSGQISWVRNGLAEVRRFPELLFGSIPVAIAVVTLALIGLVLLHRRGSSAVGSTLLVWAVLPPVVGYLSYDWLHLFVARYYLFCLPAWCLLAAAGLSTLAGRHWPVAAGAAAVTAVALVGAPAQVSMRQPTNGGQPAYGAMAHYLEAQTQPGDGVAFNDGFTGASYVARMALDYTAGDGPRPRDVFVARSAADSGWFSVALCRDPASCLGDTQRLWLVETGHPGDPFAGLPPSYADLLRTNFRVVSTTSFDRIRAILLERR
jgi:mannosyltransferase